MVQLMTTEAQAQQAIRLAAPKHGVTLWRNNSGATQDETGRQIRFGLGNDSAKVNKLIKSHDLIGITPVVITLDMVGQTVGVFTSVEVKRPGWVYTGTEREQAQKRWGDLINKLGGKACFACGPDEVWP